MSADPSPQATVDHMLEYGEEIARAMLSEMDEEEATAMVRDFVEIVSRWQPNVASHAGDPVMLGISCLATAYLFQMAFKKAYLYTDKKVDAINALKNALGETE